MESLLEFDLFRELDRDPQIRWILAQPLALSEPGPRKGSSEHFPDFLTVDADGVMKVWDVRHPDRVDDAFRVSSQMTDAACLHRGVAYEVFTGFAMTRKVQLQWIDCYRRKPANLDAFKAVIDQFVGPGCRLGDLLEHVGHYGIPAVWHLIWSGSLVVDLDSRPTPTSLVTRR